MSDNRMYHLKAALEAMFGIAAELCISREEMDQFAQWVREQLNGYGLTDTEEDSNG